MELFEEIDALLFDRLFRDVVNFSRILDFVFPLLRVAVLNVFLEYQEGRDDVHRRDPSVRQNAHLDVFQLLVESLLASLLLLLHYFLRVTEWVVDVVFRQFRVPQQVFKPTCR